MRRSFGSNSFRPFYRPRGVPKPHHCPETGEVVSYYHCASECSKHGVHVEGDLPRCKYEHEDLQASGFYAKTEDEWLDVLSETDPETYQRLIEEKRNRERVLEEMEAERSGVMTETSRDEQDRESQNPEQDDKAKPESEEDAFEEEAEEDEDPDDWW